MNLERKGNYTETFNLGLEAAEARNPPHILQVYEVATQTMMLRSDLYRPVDQIMKQYFKRFDTDVYIDTVKDFYSRSDGRMCSFPWNVSTGILYYNKKAFKDAGLNPEMPPRTWEDLEKMEKNFIESSLIGFTTAWPAAYHIELMSSWHDLPFASHSNGFDGLSARLIFNDTYRQNHMSKLAQWQKTGLFSYQGRFPEEPEELFTSGKAAILLQGANRFPLLSRKMTDPIGVGFMPFWKHMDGAPHRLNIGGSSFWVMEGLPDEVYRGIAHFFLYLSQSEIQAKWHQNTGYLPVTDAAYYLTKKKGFYKNNPASEIAILKVLNAKATPNTKGIQLGNYTQVREKIIDAIEKVFQGEASASEALEEASIVGNAILEAYEKEQEEKAKDRI